jgi:serine protease Do
MLLVLSLALSPLGLNAKDTSETVPKAFAKAVPTSIADLESIQRHIEALVRQVEPAVVAVRIGISAGSGVVVSDDGFVLCAAHVCGAPNRDVLFTFPDGRTARGKTLGTNHDLDSGLMKITEAGPWPHVPMAEVGSTRIGDWVLTLGHPGGFDPNRRPVARLGRVIRIGAMIQTDCTLIAGDSGGPLFNMEGRVAGIHSRISESTSDNFHVPIDTYRQTWDRLAQGENWGDDGTGPVSTIGVGGADAPQGCLLQRVNENGPAFRAGLRVDDIILRINDEPIGGADALVRAVRQRKPGDIIRVLVRRAETEQSFDVKIESRPRGRGGWRSPP